ncbi:hypothetical protein EVJ33_03390 [Exiguobacterium sp. SL-10]|uniref:hypothetical protein n=1 Tax=Exiguobacterium sp. SL-10 TaxID=2510962 RepID=UPI00103E80FB|nr:hypothetical protein [Exiguobacterium sp. SL-10]TCI31107.1 hypothetical protein EVJ33_03390 [Exiguobacterium sp. SL-10]
MDQVRVLLQDAIRFQQALMTSSFQTELIEGASPVLWYGRPTEKQWLTIGTNPSRGEFFERDGTVRKGESQKFYWRDESLDVYLQDERALEATLDYAATYFEAGRATTSWFGKPGGAKLEAILEGMGRSFYDGSALHVDFFKYATWGQMGQLRTGRQWMEHPTSLDLLERTIRHVNPSRVIVLGRENCAVFPGFTDQGEVEAYPSARFELGYHATLGIPMIGLHFKPSEVFVGLGNGRDAFGLHHGSYAKREHIIRIAAAIEASARHYFG